MKDYLEMGEEKKGKLSNLLWLWDGCACRDITYIKHTSSRERCRAETMVTAVAASAGLGSA